MAHTAVTVESLSVFMSPPGPIARPNDRPAGAGGSTDKPAVAPQLARQDGNWWILVGVCFPVQRRRWILLTTTRPAAGGAAGKVTGNRTGRLGPRSAGRANRRRRRRQ